MILPVRLIDCLMVLCGAFSVVNASQSCNPAVVSYLVRDERGAVLSNPELKSVYDQLPKNIGDAGLNAQEVSFMDDMRRYYWPESVDWPKGIKQPALEFANAATCTMHLSEVTLIYHGQQMHLIFNLDIDRTQPARRIVVDSLPFQPGTFVLDMSGWSRDPDTLITSERWKKSPKAGAGSKGSKPLSLPAIFSKKSG